jgi:hypothetical protein
MKDGPIKARANKLSGMERELFLLRTKLEIRSWFLRFSLALNAAMLIQFLVRFK